MRLAVAALALAACTDDSSSSSGPAVTSSVEFHDVVASDGGVCIDGTLADVDPNTPGPQYDCSVSDRATDQTETLIHSCDNAIEPRISTNKTCWGVVTSAACTHSQMIEIERENAPPDGMHVIIQCVTTTP